ncbi:MAG TPA: BrnA antitoxin family protein [Gammaproteobacteria bacterium]|nr:BrnA antitoxin family protein [Gammaproteobacteria bacterium]
MANRKSLIKANGEVRELSAEDMAKFKPAAEVLPLSLRKKLGVRGPQKMPTQERITIRLSREVVEQFRESGEGWQTRMDTALREWLKNHSPRNPT